MNPKYKKVYCCTPVAFHANDGFFIRDTGLISRTLQSMGIESKCIMPLPHYEDDQREGLIRTEYSNLESTQWWQNLGIDAVVLYSWGAPRYRKIAKAVRRANLKLVIHMDSSGDFVGDFPPGTSWWTKVKRHIRTKAEDFFRSSHLKQADVITICPTAAQAISQKLFFGKWVQDKCFPMPCPVSPDCKYEGGEKKDIILCIGRWNDTFQKRPEVLQNCLETLYRKGCTAETRIYGTITDSLRVWHNSLPAEISEKIKLEGYIQNHLLRQEYNQAKILLCTSLYEGSHNVSAEALCCGCTVVTCNRPVSLCDLHWYTSQSSGTISEKDSAESLADAVISELQLWNAGARNPDVIATAWQPHFHADKVFNSIFS